MHYRILDRRPAGPSFQPRTEIILCQLDENKATPQVTWVMTPDGERYYGHYFSQREIDDGTAREDFMKRGRSR